MKTKNPVMVKAGKKAAITRKKNKEAEHQKWVEAGKKAYQTKLLNQRKNAIIKIGNNPVKAKHLNKVKKVANVSAKSIESFTTLIGLTVLSTLEKRGYKIVKA